MACKLTARTRVALGLTMLSAASALLVAGCPIFDSGNGNDNENANDNAPPYSNSTDKTNSNANYVGSSACRNCHSDISELQLIHGHAHKLTRIEGQPPQFPPEGTRAGIPDPPEGSTWGDIAYVIGGYTKKGRFVDHEGYILTNGFNGVNTQWNLTFAPNGTTPGWGPYEADRSERKPYDFSCFQCHTTGPQPLDEDFPEYQDNRPGLAGTWNETGVQCEACHGPGSGHFTTTDGEVVIDTTRVFVDPDGSQSCKQCHNRPFNDQTGTIVAQKGFIQHHEQWPELRASGGHAGFACTVCHDPHRSVTYDRANAIRNECTDCHADQTMAGHGGKVFTRPSDGYTETLTCESCHMPYATKSATNASTATVGSAARVGDTRTHIFRISTEPVDYTQFFTDDGKQVRRDANGWSAVTVDFVCLRCHNENGPFDLSVERAAEIAQRIHELPE